MELKRNKLLIRMTFIRLLIVPYGIETKEEVDYEVEQQLLIVPYGIETPFFASLNISKTLLIVPYGIETWNVSLRVTLFVAFNRTLWN